MYAADSKDANTSSYCIQNSQGYGLHFSNVGPQLPAFMYHACRQHEELWAKHCSNLTVVSFVASAVSVCKAQTLVI